MSNYPTLGRIVYFRSRTGKYTLSAEVIGTVESIAPKGIELGHVPALSSPFHVHLLVRSPAMVAPARTEANDFIDGSDATIENPVNGLYREWDVAPNELVAPGGVAGLISPSGSLLTSVGTDDLGGWEVTSLTENHGNDEFFPRTWAWPKRAEA